MNNSSLTPFELCDAVIASGIEYGNHESDLYVHATREAEALLARYEFRSNVTTFVNKGKFWFDVPFSYAPFWRVNGGPK